MLLTQVNMKKQKGQATLAMVLLLGLVAIGSALASGSLSVSNVVIEHTITASNQAWYAAWAGIDEFCIGCVPGKTLD